MSQTSTTICICLVNGPDHHLHTGGRGGGNGIMSHILRQLQARPQSVFMTAAASASNRPKLMDGADNEHAGRTDWQAVRRRYEMSNNDDDGPQKFPVGRKTIHSGSMGRHILTRF